MPMYLCHHRCNHETWPVDRQEQMKVWAAIVKDAVELIEDGPVKYAGWISNTEGYALVEASSKSEVLRLCARFWPFFHNDVMEIVAMSEAGPAILAGVREGWEKEELM